MFFIAPPAAMSIRREHKHLSSGSGESYTTTGVRGRSSLLIRVADPPPPPLPGSVAISRPEMLRHVAISSYSSRPPYSQTIPSTCRGMFHPTAGTCPPCVLVCYRKTHTILVQSLQGVTVGVTAGCSAFRRLCCPHQRFRKHFGSYKCCRFGLNRRSHRGRTNTRDNVSSSHSICAMASSRSACNRLQKVFTRCVPVLGGGLLSSGVGRFHVSYSASISNRHRTTAPTMSACSKLQQLYTGCVAVLSDALLCPGAGRVGVSTNWTVTGCVPALGGGLSCLRGWQGRRFREPVDHQLCFTAVFHSMSGEITLHLRHLLANLG